MSGLKTSKLPAPLFLALRNLHLRWWRTLLTLFGIILGVAVVLATQVTNQTTIDSLRGVFDRATGKASILVVPTIQDGDLLSGELLMIAGNTTGVMAAAPSVQVRTLLASELQDWQINFSMGGVAAGNMFLLFGIDPQVDPQVRVYQLSSGRMPGEGRYEVVIAQEFAEEKKLFLGNYLELLGEGRLARLKIVGLLTNEGVSLLNNGVVGFAPLEVVQDLFERGDQYDEIALVIEQSISEDPQALEALKKRIAERIGDKGDVVFPSGRGALVSQMLATYQLGLSLFSLIALFVGAFLIYNTFSMTIAERSREIGMLRAIGMDSRQVLASVIFEALLYSLVGSGLGILAGIYLSRGLTRLVGDVVTPINGLVSISWIGLLQSLGVGVGVTLVAAYLPALRASRISPVQAMQVRSRLQSHVHPAVWISGLVLMLGGYLIIYQLSLPDEVVFPVGSAAIFMILCGGTLSVPLVFQRMEKVVKPVVAWIFGNEGKIGSSNIKRSVSRTTLTIAALMVALTMIISISSVAFSFRKDMAAWIDSALGGDLYVRGVVPLRESFIRNLENVPGIEVVTPTRVITVRAALASLPPGVTDDTFYFTAIDIPTLRKIAGLEFTANQGDLEANWQRLEQGQALFVTNVTADRYELVQGDTLTLLTRRGERNFYIAGIVIDFTGQSGLLYGTYNDLHDLFAEQGVDRFTIKIKQGYQIEEVAQTIKDRYQQRRHISVQSTQDFKDSILSLVNQSFRLFDVLSLIGVFIGGMGVVNTLTMNVIERQQEVGALRSLGMTRRQVTRMVLSEALALGIIGGIYGLCFGYVMARVMIHGMNTMIGYDLVYRFTIQPFITGVVMALVVSQLAAFYPAQRAASVNIVEAVKHE